MLGLQGEERARVEEFDVAVRALSDKLATKDPMFFSRVPYQLCYARGGNRIQFFALDLQHAGARVLLSDSFTLTLPHSRSLCVAYVVNMFQVMRTLDNGFPEPCWTMDNGLFELKDLCTVVIGSDYVEKCTTAFTGSVVLELHQVLLVDPIKCPEKTIATPVIENDRLSLMTHPLGCFRLSRAEQVKHAAHSVLEALCGLHAIGWVHRDVHPSNIMATCKQQCYLTALDWTQKTDQPIGDYEPKG